jgi:Origin recognition complex subunit 2
MWTFTCANPAGVGFHSLVKQCRSKFLVGNEANLKAHLAEFRDHQLLRERC